MTSDTLDKRDIKILQILTQDARISYSLLGKKLSISTNAAKYRLDKLIEEKVLLGTIPVINYAKLGLGSCQIFLKVRDRKELTFKDFIKTHTKIMWAAELFGTWDYLVEIVYSNTYEIEEIVESLALFFGESFENCKTNLTARRIKLIQKIPKSEEPRLFVPINKASRDLTIVRLDQSEKNVLHELSLNGRASYKEIGDKTNLSLQTTKNIIQRLVKNGVIEHFMPHFNFKKFNYTNYILNISLYKITKESIAKLYESIKNTEEITIALKILNRPDIFLQVKVDHPSKFEEFTKNFYKENSQIIKDLEFMHSQGTLKLEHFPEGLR